MHYLPQGDASSPSGRWGICARALPEVLTETTDAGNCFNHEYVCEDYFSLGDMDLDEDSLPDLDIPSDNAIDIGDYYGEIVSNFLPLPPAYLDARCCYRIVGNVIDAAYCDGFCKLALDCCIADNPDFNYYLAENKAVCVQYEPCMNIDEYSVMGQDTSGIDVGGF
jgi:hypothetical protein